MDLAEGRAPPPRRRRMYDDNNEKPEQEDYTFHPLLPPTRLLAPSSNTETRPGPTIPPVSRATTHLSEQNPRTSIKVQEQLPPPSLSRFKRKRTMDEDEISLDEDYVEELTVSPDKQQTVTQPARDDVPPDIDIDMEVQSREDLPPDVEGALPRRSPARRRHGSAGSLSRCHPPPIPFVSMIPLPLIKSSPGWTRT